MLSILRLLVVAVLFLMLGCQNPFGGSKASSPEMTQILRKHRVSRWDLDTAGLKSQPLQEEFKWQSTNMETFALPTRRNTPDAFRFQIILDKNTRVYWILRQGGINPQVILFGPHQLNAIEH